MSGHVKVLDSEQDDEDDKDDGSTHATVVADLAETTKLQGEQEVLEKHEIR